VIRWRRVAPELQIPVRLCQKLVFRVNFASKIKFYASVIQKQQNLGGDTLLITGQKVNWMQKLTKFELHQNFTSKTGCYLSAKKFKPQTYVLECSNPDTRFQWGFLCCHSE
jgi:hypothetical protein